MVRQFFNEDSGSHMLKWLLGGDGEQTFFDSAMLIIVNIDKLAFGADHEGICKIFQQLRDRRHNF